MIMKWLNGCDLDILNFKHNSHFLFSMLRFEYVNLQNELEINIFTVQYRTEK